jgi:hypothetical protein
MSNRYTADGKRRSSQTHARRTYECTCGKVVAGNGGRASHRKACDGRYLGYTERYEKSLAKWQAEHPESGITIEEE